MPTNNQPLWDLIDRYALMYGKGIGYTVRGLFLDGQEVFYRTEAEHKQHERDERYGKDAADLVRKWDADETIWSIELGGFGPGYEQALHVAAVEFAREGLDVPLEGDREQFFREGWDEVCNNALERIKPWFTGLSDAQFGAAKWLAWQWVHGAGPAFVADPKYDERTIQVSRRWVPGCAAHACGVASQSVDAYWKGYEDGETHAAQIHATGVQDRAAGVHAEALRQIAYMDPQGVRADDLGRAARLAREALASGVEAAPAALSVDEANTAVAIARTKAERVTAFKALAAAAAAEVQRLTTDGVKVAPAITDEQITDLAMKHSLHHAEQPQRDAIHPFARDLLVLANGVKGPSDGRA